MNVSTTTHQAVQDLRSYRAPTLVMYGRLRELTGAGTGSKVESGATTVSKRP